MSVAFGRARATVDLHKSASLRSTIIGGFGAGVLVEILADQGEWLQVRYAGMPGAVVGYVPRLAIAIPRIDAQFIFPVISIDGEAPVDAVPRKLRAAEFMTWLGTGGKPGWLADSVWNRLDAAHQQTLADEIRAAVQQRQATWDAWQLEVFQNGRSADASLEEWLTILEGGQDAWAIRPERIMARPASNITPLGWVGTGDILLRTGHITQNTADVYRLWSEVGVHKMGKDLKGWFRHELLEEYTFPTAENDPDNPENAQHVFDLTKPLLRIPADPEIAQTLAAGYAAAQYIDVRGAINKPKRHFNLCGEFCTAALAGSDIIPLLKEWADRVPRGKTILANNQCTTPSDLNSILALRQRQGELYRHSPSISSISPKRLKERLSQGWMALAGVGISNRGRVEPKGAIAHWIVLEDVFPVGNDGWVRLYNPFMNREEVYSYEVFSKSMEVLPVGLWINQPPGRIV